MKRQVEHSPIAPPGLDSGVVLKRDSNQTLVEQIVAMFQRRIEHGAMRAGTRLPSIRDFAEQQGVSRFTVVEAYDRLVARGFLESRRGSGFFVCLRQLNSVNGVSRAWADSSGGPIDVAWLLRNMFKRLPAERMPGAGLFPTGWLDSDLINQAVRALGRQQGGALLDYGHPQGYLPLREQLQSRLATLEINAPAENIVTTNGVTQALDIIAQYYLRDGDTVLVEEPSWFLLFGRFASLGVKVVGVPRTADGPDLGALERAMEIHKPRLFFTTGVLHNPTGSSINNAHAYQLLRLAERFDVTLVEDDIYSDLHPGSSLSPSTRLASLDGLRRVIYVGGFSKTLAANLRVGFIAATAELVRDLTDLKMLMSLTSSELGERVVYRVLSEGHYRRHLQRLRHRLDMLREPVLHSLEQLGFQAQSVPAAGMFLWVDTGVDANRLAQAMMDADYLMAPGSLFLPDQRDSTWMRFNIASSNNPAMLATLRNVLRRL